MARPLRIEIPGGLYHVTSRGNRQEDIFLNEEDRRSWLEIFAEVCQRYHWSCHAWCQMSNHYHIVVETVEGNLTKGMRQLNGVYTQRMNRRYRRAGHIFQGRYRAILVEKDVHLLELLRYVLLNPVRAKMVAEPGDWPWSSYQAMTGEVIAPEWLDTDGMLSSFGATRRQAIAGCREFIRSGMKAESPWQSLRGQIFLGSDTFVDRLRENIPDTGVLREIPRPQRRPLAKPIAEYRDTIADSHAAMAAAYASGNYTLQQIADGFGVHSSTVSRAVKKAEGK
jgi:REP element-mobilizing transposase RayT